MLASIPTIPRAVALAVALEVLSLSLLLSPASAATVTFSIPPSPQIPHPGALPPSTHATLTALGSSYAAPLTTDDAFVFRNVTPGSYLADVHCATHGFAPLRVDVVSSVTATPGNHEHGDEEGVRLRVWETFRGNDWENKGEEIRPAVVGGAFPVKVLGSKVYYTERGSCELSICLPPFAPRPLPLFRSLADYAERPKAKTTLSPIVNVLSILKNPMILMGLVSLALFVGMPKLVENSTFFPLLSSLSLYLPSLPFDLSLSTAPLVPCFPHY